MTFKLSKRMISAAESPEALFRDLRNRSVEGLLSQQADMLRKYMEHVDNCDVAMQMPTGSGKTLVGLLIAEWRRRIYRERAVYLCPTRQLVNQVVEQARHKYGIQARAFTGSQRDYGPSEKSEYISAEVLAVTTYSGLFNTNSFFDNAQFIVLDDAHAAENYVGSYWSLKIDKRNDDQRTLYDAVLSVLDDVLPSTDVAKLINETADGEGIWANMLPGPVFYEKHDELLSIFDVHCTQLSDLRYKWQVLREKLSSCQLYYGATGFLIRPLIPPTESHAAFADAKQRVYMSATLGDGGELERLVGKRSLTRIPAPTGWDKQGIGRRLFFFPLRSLDEDECQHLIIPMVEISGRALILTPSRRDADVFRQLIQANLADFTIFEATDIEHSKNPFISDPNAVAIIANRYDGIDLVGDECRLLIASGLPKATNLQEQFLITRMGLPILYHDRIRTRFVQAIGRCTRSSTDYAAIVILGEQLNNFLLQSDTRKYLHPELQAEIEFGIEESRSINSGDFIEYLRTFMDHGADWNKADEYIVAQRDELLQEPLPCFAHFISSVSHEVAYQYALWREDYQSALEESRKVLAKDSRKNNLTN
jgi:hypothetical protein